MGTCYHKILPTEAEILTFIRERFVKNNNKWAKFELDIAMEEEMNENKKITKDTLVYVGDNYTCVLDYQYFLQCVDKIMNNNRKQYTTSYIFCNQESYYHIAHKVTKNKFILIEVV